MRCDSPGAGGAGAERRVQCRGCRPPGRVRRLPRVSTAANAAPANHRQSGHSRRTRGFRFSSARATRRRLRQVEFSLLVICIDRARDCSGARGLWRRRHDGLAADAASRTESGGGRSAATATFTDRNSAHRHTQTRRSQQCRAA